MAVIVRTPPTAERPRVTPPQAGARSEMVAAIDLMERGFDVFSQVGAHGLVDLVAIHRHHHSRPIPVEVKTGIAPPRSSPESLYTPNGAGEKWAVLLAVVDPRDLAVFYLDVRSIRKIPKGGAAEAIDPLMFYFGEDVRADADHQRAQEAMDAGIWPEWYLGPRELAEAAT